MSDRAVIALEGPEARPFLQSLVTNDMTDLAPGHALYAALLAPQGKILFDFIIAEGDGAASAVLRELGAGKEQLANAINAIRGPR